MHIVCFTMYAAYRARARAMLPYIEPPPASLPHSSQAPRAVRLEGPLAAHMLLQLGAGWAAAWSMTSMLVDAAGAAAAAGGAGAGAARDGGPGQGAGVAGEGLGHPGCGVVLQLGCYTVRAPGRASVCATVNCSVSWLCVTVQGYPVGRSLKGNCLTGRQVRREEEAACRRVLS